MFSLLLYCSSLIVFTSGRSHPEEPCHFSKDCKQYSRCRNVADVSCICNFGQCEYRGNPFFRGEECQSYNDCNCSEDPLNCQCINGFCRDEPTECHQDDHCSRFEKCNGLDCRCRGNLCEWECHTTSDCPGQCVIFTRDHMCGCQRNLCTRVPRPRECRNIGDCVEKEKCLDNEPCLCRGGYCDIPMWFTNFKQLGDCRENLDCELLVHKCKNKNCVCANISSTLKSSIWPPPRGGPMYITRGNCEIPEIEGDSGTPEDGIDVAAGGSPDRAGDLGDESSEGAPRGEVGSVPRDTLGDNEEGFTGPHNEHRNVREASTTAENETWAQYIWNNLVYLF